MKKRIVQTGNDTQANHRADFRTCPLCSFEMPPAQWDRAATTLILAPLVFRSGAVAVMSECPKCFEGSWVHETMGMAEFREDWPAKWREAVAKLERTVKLQALRDWGASLCHRCRKLESGEVNHHAWRHCPIGSGPAAKACSAFEELG
jgi:hypothetical protein